MPAPFVVAHLQVGLTMQELDAALADDGKERAQVFLTNALTGWEPRTTKPLPFPELEEERDRAERVKQTTPILVILGNPPYNGFAGMAVDEERELSDAYRTTKRVRQPKGQGLNDLYVRFFRMAERRITKTGQGVVCFISNYSWLDGLSFSGMRERYLGEFDAVRIDNLHGDRIISEYAPDGRTSETVFALQGESPGIKVGASIALFSRSGTANTSTDGRILYRDFHQARADERRQALLDSLDDAEIDAGYTVLKPNLRLGLPFKPASVSKDWFDWPALPDLFPVSFPGVKTSRDGFLVDTDLDRLRTRIGDYFDESLIHDEIARRYPGTMKVTTQFNASAVRDTLLKRGGPLNAGFIRFTYRPFDIRWLYWEADSGLIDRPRPDYKPHVFKGNVWLEAREREAKEDFSRGTLVRHLSDNFGNGLSSFFPAYLFDDGSRTDGNEIQRRPNLSGTAQHYLYSLGADVEDLFHHVIATLHDPAYREANAGALRMGWPRMPLPAWPDGNDTEASDILARSAALGRELAALLDPETPVSGVTIGTLHPEIAAIAVPATRNNRNMTSDDFALTAGWGHFGSAHAIMPGQGRAVERNFTPDERAALADTLPTLGDTTFDIYLNDRAFWCNVPAATWRYKLGGYQVLKKWLSYREQTILDRALTPEEVQYFADTTRRIAKVLLVTSKIPVS